MTNAELKVIISLRDEITKKVGALQGRMRKFSADFKKNWLRNAAMIAATIIVVKKLTHAWLNANKALIDVSSQVEQLQIRLRVLLGSAEEGNKVFQDMSELAAKVPKTYDEIMESATALAAVVRGGSEEVKALMPIIVDLSSATGIAVRDVTSQMIRMYSAGAASADMFRERGVLAMLGFKAGVSYTAEETMKQVVASWQSATSKFRGASEELAESYEGMTSMMSDAWFQFKVAVGEEIFKNIKNDMRAVLKLIGESKEEGGKYGEVIEDLAEFFAEAYENAKDFVSFLIVSAANAVDAWNDVLVTFEVLKTFINSAAIGAQKLLIAAVKIINAGASLPMMPKSIINLDVELLEQTLADMEREMKESMLRTDKIVAAGSTDWSAKVAEGVAKIRAAIESTKRTDAFMAPLEESPEMPALEVPGGEVDELLGEIGSKYADFQAEQSALLAETSQEQFDAFFNLEDLKIEKLIQNTEIAKTLQQEALLEQLNAKKQAVLAEGKLDDNRVKKLQAIEQARDKIVWKTLSKQLGYYSQASQSMMSSIATMFEVAQGESKKYASVIKALRIGETIIHTATAVMRAFADVPYPANIAVATAVAAQGAAQVAVIAAQKLHMGGFIGGLASDEVPIIAQTGEGMLSHKGMAALGGVSNLNALNQGRAATGPSIHIEIHDPVMRSADDIDDLSETIAEKVSDAIAQEAERL